MADQFKTFISISPEIQAELADNGYDWLDLLGDGIQVNIVKPEPIDLEVRPKGNYKTTTILASATLLAILTPTLHKGIEALSSKPVIVHQWVAVPATDAQGDIIKDENGEPIIERVRQPVVFEPSNPIPMDSKVSVKFLGLEFEYRQTPGG